MEQLMGNIHENHVNKTPDDPMVRHIRDGWCKGADLYHEEKGNSETICKYSQNCPNDWVDDMFTQARIIWEFCFYSFSTFFYLVWWGS